MKDRVNVRETRDWRFEALRLAAMLGIVTAHFFASDRWDVHMNPDRVFSFGS